MKSFFLIINLSVSILWLIATACTANTEPRCDDSTADKIMQEWPALIEAPLDLHFEYKDIASSSISTIDICDTILIIKKYRANVIEKNDTIILLPEAELNLRQLVSSIHPATIPYYYGDLIEGDPEILIMLNNDTILIDKDFSRSVIPSELNQLYKYLAFATFELDLPEDLP